MYFKMRDSFGNKNEEGGCCTTNISILFLIVYEKNKKTNEYMFIENYLKAFRFI